jgi:hypothetical protein
MGPSNLGSRCLASCQDYAYLRFGQKVPDQIEQLMRRLDSYGLADLSLLCQDLRQAPPHCHRGNGMYLSGLG